MRHSVELTTAHCILFSNSSTLASYCRTRRHNVSHVVGVYTHQTGTIVVDDVLETIGRPNNLHTCTVSSLNVLLIMSKVFITYITVLDSSFLRETLFAS